MTCPPQPPNSAHPWHTAAKGGLQILQWFLQTKCFLFSLGFSKYGRHLENSDLSYSDNDYSKYPTVPCSHSPAWLFSSPSSAAASSLFSPGSGFTSVSPESISMAGQKSTISPPREDKGAKLLLHHHSLSEVPGGRVEFFYLSAQYWKYPPIIIAWCRTKLSRKGYVFSEAPNLEWALKTHLHWWRVPVPEISHYTYFMRRRRKGSHCFATARKPEFLEICTFGWNLTK